MIVTLKVFVRLVGFWLAFYAFSRVSYFNLILVNDGPLELHHGATLVSVSASFIFSIIMLLIPAKVCILFGYRPLPSPMIEPKSIVEDFSVSLLLIRLAGIVVLTSLMSSPFLHWSITKAGALWRLDWLEIIVVASLALIATLFFFKPMAVERVILTGIRR